MSQVSLSDFVRDIANPPLCKSQSKDVNSDWLADQCDEPSALGHARIHKGKMNDDDPDIAAAQNPKCFDGVRLGMDPNWYG